jgi:hypothetical protein
VISLCVVVTIPLLMLPASPPTPVADAEVVALAREAFAEGVRLRDDLALARPHFARAAALLEELRGRGANNPVLYRDLGNASLLAGDLPRAILNYRRGLQLAPRDGELGELLEGARQLVAVPQGSSFGRPPRDERPAWLRLPPHGVSVAVALLCHVSACLLLARWFMKRNFRLLWLSGLLFLTAAAGAYAVVLHRGEEERERTHPVVIVARENEFLRRGNGHSYPPRYPAELARGVEGRLLHERGGWLLIELSEGETGWLHRESVLVVEPQKPGDASF